MNETLPICDLIKDFTQPKEFKEVKNPFTNLKITKEKKEQKLEDLTVEELQRKFLNSREMKESNDLRREIHRRQTHLYTEATTIREPTTTTVREWVKATQRN